MTEKLEHEHSESDPSITDDEIRAAIAMMNIELKDPQTMPRRKEFLDRRIGQLVFEYHFRTAVDVKKL